MLIRSIALLLTLSAAPALAQDAMRLDLGGTPPQTASAQPAAKPTPKPVQTAQAAQAQAPAGNADDKDHIIACSIVYQRIADKYRERGEEQKADGFLSTAYAYSQASDILYAKEVGAENAYDAISQRMVVVSESLNRESQTYSNGDLGVINSWLGWCDKKGDFVQATMDAYNAQQPKPPAP